MPARHRAVARSPRGSARAGVPLTSDAVAHVLEDAAHFPGGHARAVATPHDEAEIAALIHGRSPLLAIGAQSSLTGGATPMGELVVSTAALDAVLPAGRGRIRVQPGVTLERVAEALASHGAWYPPAPTFLGATCGGVVATNAAGPATFKYGTTRAWVDGLVVVLASGWVLDIERGQVLAHDDGYFDIEEGETTRRVPVMPLRWPDVPKCSAGYDLRPGMDLVDLFVGSEGTLGIVSEVTFRIAPLPAARCLAFVPVPTRSAALDLVADLRDEARRTWAARDPRGIDVAAIEHVDARAIALLRARGADRRHDVAFPDGCEVALFVELELGAPVRGPEAWAQVASALQADAADVSLVRFCRLLARRALLDDAQLALPGEARRAAQFRSVREAVPEAVNEAVAATRREHPGVSKIAADVVVPFDRFGELLDACDRAFAARGLDGLVWGHVSDGNVHPNVIPRSSADAALGRQAILEIGRAALRLGGSPLAEHGVGRNPVKQALLAELHGADGLAAMRRVKDVLDPEGLLAPGVLLSAAIRA